MAEKLNWNFKCSMVIVEAKLTSPTVLCGGGQFCLYILYQNSNSIFPPSRLNICLVGFLGKFVFKKWREMHIKNSVDKLSILNKDQ